MFQHFIITFFSCRGLNSFKRTGFDPLDENNLKHRFQIFKISCLPSMLYQAAQEFTWIIIVDPDLPKKNREQLELLVSARSDTFISEFDIKADYKAVLWLKPYIKPATRYIITTKLDDDDAIFTDFTKYIQKHFNDLKKNNNIPPLKFIGCDNVRQWDFFWSKSAPLGYFKPWTRIKSLPVSAGFTLFCKYPEFDFAVSKFNHPLFELLKTNKFKPHEWPQSKINKVKDAQQWIKTAAKRSNLDWDGQLATEDHFHYIDTNTLQIVMINHINNIQFSRIFENAQLRKAVNNAQSFPQMAIDYDLAAKYICKLRKSPSVFFKVIVKSIKFNSQHKSGNGFLKILSTKYKRLKKAISGVANMK